jgi:hypothetical protein
MTVSNLTDTALVGAISKLAEKLRKTKGVTNVQLDLSRPAKYVSIFYAAKSSHDAQNMLFDLIRPDFDFYLVSTILPYNKPAAANAVTRIRIIRQKVKVDVAAEQETIINQQKLRIIDLEKKIEILELKLSAAELLLIDYFDEQKTLSQKYRDRVKVAFS